LSFSVFSFGSYSLLAREENGLFIVLLLISLLSLSFLIISLFSSSCVLSLGNNSFFWSESFIKIFIFFVSFLTVVFLILSFAEIFIVFSIIFISLFSSFFSPLLF